MSQDTMTRYKLIESDLKKCIVEGFYQVDDMLPSENVLCNQYKMARTTVRKALQNLENEGYVERKQGLGSVVISRKKSYDLLSKQGFQQVMSEKANNVESRFLSKPVQARWPKNFDWPLESALLTAGCIKMERVRKLDGKAVMYEKTYLGHTQLPNFTSVEFINDSLFDTLNINYGVEVVDVSQKVKAVTAGSDIACVLDVEPGTPVLKIIRKLTTNQNKLDIFSFVFCNTEHFSIEL